jgi:flagellar hook-associated protein 1 FlgK
MSLSTSLLIGRSGLTAAQTGIQVAGDNISNAATPGYTRRVLSLSPAAGPFRGENNYNGQGVLVERISRALDPAILSRLRSAVSDEASAQASYQALSQVESVLAPLSETGLSTQLGEFFDAFSELANNPGSAESRTLIVQQGQSISSYLRGLRSDLRTLQEQLETQIESGVERANGLLTEIGELNRAIANSELGRGENAPLRDQRDSLVQELAGLLDVSVLERDSGAVDLYVGSTPIVLEGRSLGLDVERFAAPGGEGEPVLTIVTTEGDEQQKVFPASGQLGGLLAQRNGRVETAITEIDQLATSLAFEVNRLHSAGRPFPGLTDTTGTLRIADAADQTRALNDPANTRVSALPYGPTNGSFEITVTDAATGLAQTHRFDVDLDGITNAGAAGFGDDTSLQDIVDWVNASVGNVSASITGAGELRLTADAGFEFGFASDTSGVLATLGINTFFTGEDAADLDVRSELIANPGLLVAGLSAGSNEQALAIAQLRDAPVESLGGITLLESWRRTTDAVAVETAAARTERGAAEQVKASLEAQHATVSGVSIDEETINLISFQQQYQAAARLISTVDELTQILISLV